MERNIKDPNSIFSYALAGSLLFVAAIAYTLVNLPEIAVLNPSYAAFAIILSVTSLSLLLKAVMEDKDRLNEV